MSLGPFENWRRGTRPFVWFSSWAVFLAALACLSCAGLGKSVIEAQLIAEMEGDCKKVEIKRDYQQTVYVIAYTGRMSRDRCPLALMQEWEDGRMIREKEVEICGCRDGKKR
jgi:hypothetical protein